MLFEFNDTILDPEEVVALETREFAAGKVVLYLTLKSGQIMQISGNLPEDAEYFNQLRVMVRDNLKKPKFLTQQRDD